MDGGGGGTEIHGKDDMNDDGGDWSERERESERVRRTGTHGGYVHGDPTG